MLQHNWKYKKKGFFGMSTFFNQWLNIADSMSVTVVIAYMYLKGKCVCVCVSLQGFYPLFKPEQNKELADIFTRYM